MIVSQIVVGLALVLGQPGPTFGPPATDSRTAVFSGLPEVISPPEKIPTPPRPDGSIKPPPTTPETKIKEEECVPGGILHRFFKAYIDEFAKPQPGIFGDCKKKKDDKNGDDKKDDDGPAPAPRRALPEPWSSPPFPGHEYQGYPLMGVPRSDIDEYPLMKALVGDTAGIGDFIKDNHIKIYGWATGSGNFSTSPQTNAPTSYWIVANSFQLDQAVLRFEREADTRADRPLGLGFSLHIHVRRRLPLHHRRRLDERSAPEKQSALRFGPDRTVYRRLRSACIQGHRHGGPRRPLGCLPGHRNATGPRQLHGQPLAAVHL